MRIQVSRGLKIVILVSLWGNVSPGVDFYWFQNKCRSVMTNLQRTWPRAFMFEGHEPPGFFENAFDELNKIPNGATVRVFDFNDRLSLLDPSNRWSPKTILRANSEFEKWLVTYAFDSVRPRDIMDIQTFNKNEIQLEHLLTPVMGHIGSTNALPVRLAWLSFPHSADTYLVEIAQTLTRYEFSYSYNRKNIPVKGLALTPVPQTDLAALRNISLNHALYLRIKVILPNGYYYQQTLKNGVTVSDPFERGWP